MVDDENSLVAGERRLRACRMLGWQEIPARLYSDLTEAERDEIEREENQQRLNLSPYELSKQKVQKAEKVAPVIAEKRKQVLSLMMHEDKVGQSDISSTSDEIKNKKNPGRKSDFGAPKKDIAQALGISEGALVAAKQHVAAVEKYPELAGPGIPQKDVLTFSDWQSVLTTPLQYHACALRSMGKPSVGAPL